MVFYGFLTFSHGFSGVESGARSVEVDVLSCAPLLTLCEQEGLVGQEAKVLQAYEALNYEAGPESSSLMF